MPALLKCNGEVGQTNGVSTCQSKSGLIQEIKFGEPMFFADSKDKGCSMTAAPDSKKFQFKLSKKLCSFSFIEKDKLNRKRRRHLLHTIGYDQAIYTRD